jgi:hypothetical protein
MRASLATRVAGTISMFTITAGLLTTPALAQDAAVVDAGALLQSLEALSGALQAPKTPVLLGIGSGVVAPHGTAFASVSGTTDREDLPGEGVDGSLAFGFGLGDASRSVGAQVTGVISSLGTGDTGFGDSGSINLKFSRALVPSTFVGIAFDNLVAWGNEEDEESIETTVAVTRFSEFQINGEHFPLMLTAGYGTNVRDDGTEPGAILGAGVGLTEDFGASISTNTDYINLGVGMTIPGIRGLSVSSTLVDVFDQEDRRAGQLAITYSFNAF